MVETSYSGIDWVDASHSFAHCAGHRGWITRCADDDRHAAIGMLCERQEHRRVHGLIETVVPDVANDADDRRLLVRSAESHVAPHDVGFAGEERARPRLGHHDHAWRIDLVGRGERAACLEWNLESAKIVRCDSLPARGRLLPARRGWTTNDVKVRRVHRPTQRQRPAAPAASTLGVSRSLFNTAS